MERLRIKKKLITQNWSMQVNEIATSIIVVNTWLAYSQCRRGDDMMVDKKQKTFYTVLAEEIIDNRLDVANVWLWMLITRVELRNVSSDEILLDHRARIWAHLTPQIGRCKQWTAKYRTSGDRCIVTWLTPLVWGIHKGEVVGSNPAKKLKTYKFMNLL